MAEAQCIKDTLENTKIFSLLEWLRLRGRPHLNSPFTVSFVCPIVCSLWFACHLLYVCGVGNVYLSQAKGFALCALNSTENIIWERNKGYFVVLEFYCYEETP